MYWYIDFFKHYIEGGIDSKILKRLIQLRHLEVSENFVRISALSVRTWLVREDTSDLLLVLSIHHRVCLCYRWAWDLIVVSCIHLFHGTLLLHMAHNVIYIVSVGDVWRLVLLSTNFLPINTFEELVLHNISNLQAHVWICNKDLSYNVPSDRS